MTFLAVGQTLHPFTRICHTEEPEQASPASDLAVMKFRIRGADVGSGQDRWLTIEAVNEDDAVAQAKMLEYSPTRSLIHRVW